MNSNFKLKFLQYLVVAKKQKGFTLIELLVTVIIISLLAAIALPNIVGQVAKGRQAEAKNDLGVIDRAQQSYRAEKSTFTTLSNPSLGVNISGLYYTFTGPTVANNSYASHSATAVPLYSNFIKNYASAVAQDNTGVFASAICESLGTASEGQGAVVPGADVPTLTSSTPCVTGTVIN